MAELEIRQAQRFRRRVQDSFGAEIQRRLPTRNFDHWRLVGRRAAKLYYLILGLSIEIQLISNQLPKSRLRLLRLLLVSNGGVSTDQRQLLIN